MIVLVRHGETPPNRDGVHVQVRPLDRLKPAEAALVQEAGHRLGRFLERPVALSWL